ncbi:threonine transporter RhtB [Kiloniella litopenaei]|uniref:Threonine transporter RhtB n=1 Tax=Kiloniella litopenaei TaxID=1549748 RepID=A0A0M2R1N2_9PROT|nr:LysE family translocator [Kiloniella litopenaei]KKJ75782.1 threonine transporter RhtB [Kiloniella litopenaei]
MDFHLFLLFATTTAIVISSPGPSAILVISQGASYGLGRAIFGILGIAVGGMIYFTLSATGIASLILPSTFVFSTIKWIGVAFLLYLGLRALFSKSALINIAPARGQKTRIALFLQGLFIMASNPKAMLFFIAILPQFIDLDRPIAPQILIMGATTFALQLPIYSAYAYMGERITRSGEKGGIKTWFASALNKCAGAALVFAGLKMIGVTISR